MPPELVQERQLLLAQRDRNARRRERLIYSAAQLGKFIPFGWRRALATRHPRFGYLLAREREVIFDRYLGEYRVRIDVLRAIEREMLSNAYETPLRESLAPQIQSGGVVLDIGANVGALSLFFAQRVGPSGRVIAFEPGFPFFERLKGNLALNGPRLAHVEPHNLGLGEKEGQLFWQEDPSFPGNATLTLPTGTAVPVTTLDLFQSRHPIDRCDFIKIDVEGMELEVLRGAEAFVARFRPLIALEAIMEFEASCGKPIRREMEALLKRWGYRLEDAITRVPVAYPHLPAMVLARPN